MKSKRGHFLQTQSLVDYRRGGIRKLLSKVTLFVGRCTITVIKDQLSILERLIVMAVSQGNIFSLTCMILMITGVHLENMNPHVPQREKLREELFREAVRSARAQGELLAKETETKLGKVTHMTLNNVADDFGGSNRLSNSPNVASPISARTPIPFCSQTLSVSVTVTFELLS